MLPSLFEFKPEQFGLPPFDDLIDGQVSLWVHAMRCSVAACCAVAFCHGFQQLISTSAKRVALSPCAQAAGLTLTHCAVGAPVGLVEPA